MADIVRPNLSTTPLQLSVGTEPHSPDTLASLSERAAVIGGRVRSGKVVLTGLHSECSPDLLSVYYKDDEHIMSLLPMLKPFEPQSEIIFSNCICFLFAKQERGKQFRLPYICYI